MAATALLKRSRLVLEWMVETDPPRETSTVIKMYDRSLILSFNKITLRL